MLGYNTSNAEKREKKEKNNHGKHLDLTQYGVALYRRQCIFSPLFQFCPVFPHVFFGFLPLQEYYR